MLFVSRRNLRAVSAFLIPALVALLAAFFWPPEQNAPRLRDLLTQAQNLEWAGYDVFFNWRGPQPERIDNRIVIVGYDFNTVGVLQKNAQTPWPPPRKFHAQVLRNLLADGAKVVAFDVLMNGASKSGINDDRAFDKALQSAGQKVVLTCRIERSDTQNQTTLVGPYHDDALGIDFERSARTAFVDVDKDGDEIVRRISPLQKIQGQSPGPLPSEAFLALSGGSVETSQQTPGAVTVGSVRVPRTGQTKLDPTDPENQMATAYMDFPAGLSSFPMVRYEQVASGAFPKGTFAGKVVLVGVTGLEITQQENDYFTTAYSRFSPERVGGQTTRNVYGVVVQAQMLNALLKNGFLHQSQKWQTFLIVFVFSLVGTWGIRTFLNWRGPVLLVGSLLGYVLTCFLVFQNAHLYIPWVLPSVFMFANAAAIAWFERSHIRKLWAGYVSPAYMEVMLREGVEATPVRRDATVVFGDIRNFTGFSEQHPPEKVVRLLDKHLEKLVRIVFSRSLQGTVDKFLGDGIMVVFGAPKPQADFAYRAVKAAWLMREATLIPITDADGSDYTLCTGFGIATGPLVAGHVGSAQLTTYTLIGDTVNLASRLQAVTGHADIIIDQATLDLVAAHVDVEDLGLQEIKGKASEVACYKVTAWRD